MELGERLAREVPAEPMMTADVAPPRWSRTSRSLG